MRERHCSLVLSPSTNIAIAPNKILLNFDLTREKFMKCIGTYLLVEYAEDKLLKDLGNGIKIHIPERSYFDTVEGSDYTSRITDRKLVNPQLAIVKAKNPAFDFEVGDMVYLHYGAYETRYPYSEKEFFVNGAMVFFKWEDGFNPSPNTFIGKQIFKEAEKSAFGIYLTPETQIKQKCQIAIIATPKDNMGIEIGEVVYTIDDHQDVFNFQGENYVRLDARFIVSKVA